MERHHSTGVATIVALMAAHRVASGTEGAAYCQEAIDQIDAYLHEIAPNHTARRPATLTREAWRQCEVAGSSRSSIKAPEAQRGVIVPCATATAHKHHS